MARRQVIVQLDDELADSLDRLAAELDTSRSELLRRGARAVLEAHRRRGDERRHVDSYRSQPQDPAVIDAAGRLAAETVPDW